MRWANENNAKVPLNMLTIESEIDEQRGYKSVFPGSVCGYSQPQGARADVGDTPDEALDWSSRATPDRPLHSPSSVQPGG